MSDSVGAKQSHSTSLFDAVARSDLPQMSAFHIVEAKNTLALVVHHEIKRRVVVVPLCQLSSAAHQKDVVLCLGLRVQRTSYDMHVISQVVLS